MTTGLARVCAGPTGWSFLRGQVAIPTEYKTFGYQRDRIIKSIYYSHLNTPPRMDTLVLSAKSIAGTSYDIL